MKTAWERVEIARNPNRKTALDYIDKVFDEFLELHGDRISKDDASIVCGLARIGNCNFTVIAQQKGRNTKENIMRNFGMPNPESYRKAMRFMKQAEKFNRSIITFVDTKGAYPGIEAEEKGQGEAIARSMFEMSKLKVPVITIVIGEGSSGGALAISIANKIIMLENAIYSILSPEGYASILWKDSSRVQEAAEKMNLTAQDLYDLKIIDIILSEQEGFEETTENMRKEILKEVSELSKMSQNELVEQRYSKFRQIGIRKMILEGKKILIMGIRNKWSIAFGIAKSAYENGSQLLFTYMGEDSKEKIEELISEFKGAKAYVCNGASEDEVVKATFEKIKAENGKIDGIVHAIAHANTEDLHKDFIYTEKEGYAHAVDVSAYSFVLISRLAKEMDMLNENASLLTLTYHGSRQVIEGYNVMGVAKAALEASVRYLAENLGKHGMRVNAISAGPIKTLSAKGIKDFGSILTVVEEKAPLHQNVTTTQVGDVATFLLSGMSSCVTGQIIYADNGFSIMGV